jgi:DNA-binding MarR family transcriptional regulator
VSARASDIAEAIGLTAAGATDLIDRLETRHLVQRTAHPTDRRVVLVDLTRSGERLFREAQLSQRAMLRRLTAAMTDEEQRALLEGLTALARAVRREAG